METGKFLCGSTLYRHQGLFVSRESRERKKGHLFLVTPADSKRNYLISRAHTHTHTHTHTDRHTHTQTQIHTQRYYTTYTTLLSSPPPPSHRIGSRKWRIYDVSPPCSNGEDVGTNICSSVSKQHGGAAEYCFHIVLSLVVFLLTPVFASYMLCASGVSVNMSFC